MNNQCYILERQLRAALLRIAELAMMEIGQGMERPMLPVEDIRIVVPMVSEPLSFGGMFKKLLSDATTMPSFINKNY